MEASALKYIVVSLVSNEEHKHKENKIFKYIYVGIHETLFSIKYLRILFYSGDIFLWSYSNKNKYT